LVITWKKIMMATSEISRPYSRRLFLMKLPLPSAFAGTAVAVFSVVVVAMSIDS
jgi:hypothetical protein